MQISEGMGQKVNPVAFRIGHTQNWKSRWFNKKQYQEFLAQDVCLRDFLTKKLRAASVDKIEIERFGNSINIIIFAGRPGMIVGRGGSGIEDLKKEIRSLMMKKFKLSSKIDLRLSIEEVKDTESRATIVAQNIADQIEKRIPFRRVMKQSLEKMIQSKETQGAKVMIKGRLNGNEIARKEWLVKGRLPLQTLRADIDYAQKTAYTTYGTVGIKVWIYKGNVFKGLDPRLGGVIKP